MSVRHIASLTGLSPSAVSLALRNSDKISEATKRRVREAARRLGYKPSAKVAELMSHVRLSRESRSESCLALISFYESERPWEKSLHLARIYEGMTQRAAVLGYRLEALWLRAPGMNRRRFRSILDARGIQGILCLGSPNMEEEFPTEFDHYAIVTQGLSIETPLHRVITHAYKDIWRALDKLHALGYRRPGLAISHYEEVRSAHAYVSAYLGWHDSRLGSSSAVPVLRLAQLEETPLMNWLEQQRPDVIVLVNVTDALAEFRQIIRRQRIRIPEDLGVVVISQDLKGTGFSGMQENQWQIGAWTVELVVSRIMNLDLGIPATPRLELVESVWVDGNSLRPKLISG
ncbi:MAG: LacI family DNA-binding transcriptional regulator [Opitutaceae bacterium]|jgi:DNA-binding LacI/PurR family transcriptional regulator